MIFFFPISFSETYIVVNVNIVNLVESIYTYPLYFSPPQVKSSVCRRAISLFALSTHASLVPWIIHLSGLVRSIVGLKFEESRGFLAFAASILLTTISHNAPASSFSRVSLLRFLSFESHRAFDQAIFPASSSTFHCSSDFESFSELLSKF